MYDEGDQIQVPVSAGFPPLVRWLLISTIVLVGIIACLVAFSAGQGHMWPAEDTLRLKLTSG